MAYGDVDDVDFQESVAREHVDGGMSVTQLHRGHGLPLSLVKKWVALFAEGGRAALDAAAVVAAAAAAKPLTKSQVSALRTKLQSTDTAVVVKALETVQRRRVGALVDDVLAVIEARHVHAIIPAVAALGAIGAIEHLTRAESLLDQGYATYLKSAQAAARERTG